MEPLPGYGDRFERPTTDTTSSCRPREGGLQYLRDRLMFNRVLCEKEVCRKVLRAALGIEVGEIAYLNAEQAKEPAAASRGVRMDVFAREGSRVFDIEMQVSPEDAAYRDEMLAEFGLERAE